MIAKRIAKRSLAGDAQVLDERDPAMQRALEELSIAQ